MGGSNGGRANADMRSNGGGDVGDDAAAAAIAAASMADG